MVPKAAGADGVADDRKGRGRDGDREVGGGVESCGRVPLLGWLSSKGKRYSRVSLRMLEAREAMRAEQEGRTAGRLQGRLRPHAVARAAGERCRGAECRFAHPCERFAPRQARVGVSSSCPAARPDEEADPSPTHAGGCSRRSSGSARRIMQFGPVASAQSGFPGSRRARTSRRGCGRRGFWPGQALRPY